MSLNDDRNRSVCSVFLSQVSIAMVAKARAVALTEGLTKPFALKVIQEPDMHAATAGPVLAADANIQAVPGEDPGFGNGVTYAVPDAVVVAAVELAWNLLAEV